MMHELAVRKKREFGEIVTDPLKYIFRNIKAYLIFNLIFLFVPFALAFGLLAYMTEGLGLVFFGTGELNFVLIGVTILLFYVCFSHVALSSFSMLKVAQDEDPEGITFDHLFDCFKKHYFRSLLFIFVFSLLYLLMFGIVFIGALGGIALAVLLGVVVSLIIFFYIYPLTFYAYCHYLQNEDESLSSSIVTAKEYLDANYGQSIGAILLAMIISYILQMVFAIPLLVFVLMSSQMYSMEDGGNLSLLTVSLQNLVNAISAAFLAQYIYMAVYLKYYDIVERKSGSNLLDRIRKIGQKEKSFFENEGEF